MKRTVLLMLVPLLALTRVAAASPIVFTAVLSGGAEFPANASPGTGSAIVTIDDVVDTMRVQVEFAGLVAITTASHIHVINGPGDANLADTVGPVATTTPAFPGFPLGVTSGNYDQTLDMTIASSYRAGWITDSGGTIALAEQALFDGILSGRAYLNIHTTQFPGGEIRGFLQPVPEPGSLLLLGTGALGLLRGARKRRAGAA